MENPKVEELWPKVPEELRGKEIRLPGEFRDVVASQEYSNEEIGRILRCLVMHTDLFNDTKLGPTVYYFRQKEAKREYFRNAVKKHRAKVAASDDSSSPGSFTVKQNDISVKENCFTVKPMSITAKSEDGSQWLLPPIEKTPTNPKEKTPPIVPLKKKTPSSLEKRGLEVQGDLFASTARPECRETGKERPQTHPDVLDAQVVVQDIESDSRPTGEASKAMRTMPSGADSRSDAAWIPQKFEIFWARYPRKVAKKDAFKAFTKAIKAQDDVEKFMSTLLASVEWWRAQPGWKKDGGKFIPYPATWLNRGSWADSAENSSSPGSAEFLGRSEESDEDLIRRMSGG